jgi:hypothetical protein
MRTQSCRQPKCPIDPSSTISVENLFDHVSNCWIETSAMTEQSMYKDQTSKEGIRAHCPSVVGSIDG